MRAPVLAFAAAAILSGLTLNAPVASAQAIEVGPGGVGVDLRSPRQRDRDFQREEARRDRDYDRRRASRYDDDVSTGSLGRCREVTVRERNSYGEVETRTRRDCR